MKGMYFYRDKMIQRTPCNKGWYFKDDLEVDVYKTITDALNAIDKKDGNFYSTKGGVVPKRRDKPIEIIGKMTFILDCFDENGKVHSHYEYEWNNKIESAYNI